MIGHILLKKIIKLSFIIISYNNNKKYNIIWEEE